MTARTTTFRPRVLVTKIGLDGHDRGSRIVAAACRDAGMEVIYTPPWQTIAAVVKLALEEDVDVVGISSLATDHLIVPKLMTRPARGRARPRARRRRRHRPRQRGRAAARRAACARCSIPAARWTRSPPASATTRSRRARPAPRRRGEHAMNKPVDRRSPARRRRDAEGALAARVRRSHRHRPRHRQRLRHPGPARSTTLPTGPPTGQAEPLGYPGQPDYTRGIYATMHRGRTWTQRQLIGLGTPADYNERLLGLLARGATAVSLIPCNSVYRGYDMDSVEPELLGTCGVVVNNADHMDRCLDGVDLDRDLVRDERSVAVHAARLHAGRRRAARHRLEQDHRHLEPERLPLALRRQPHVLPALAAGRAPRADGPHRLLPREGAALEPDVGGRPAHAAGGRDAGRGDGVHALDARCRTPRTASPAAWTPTSSCRASPSSSTSRSASSRRSPSSAPAGASGRGWRASASARRTRRRGASSSTPRPRAST